MYTMNVNKIIADAQVQKLQIIPIVSYSMIKAAMWLLDNNCQLIGKINWHHIQMIQKHNGQSSKKFRDPDKYKEYTRQRNKVRAI